MAAPTFVAASALGFTSGTGSVLTKSWPSHQAGDIGLLLVVTNNEAVSFASRNGFGLIGHPPEAQGAGGIAGSTRLDMYWCRARSSAMRAPRLWAPPLSMIGATILTFRGCIQTGNPWNSTFGNGGDTAAVSIPISNTTVDECLIVAATTNATDTAVAQASGWTNASLTSVTERFDENSALGFGGGISVATGIDAVAGSINAMTATLATASNQAHLSLALKPAVAVGAVDLYNFLTLQDPAAPDLEITLHVTDFRETKPDWRGTKERAFAGNFLDSRHTRKRVFSATVDAQTPAEFDVLEDFVDRGPSATTGEFLGPRALYLRGDPFGAIRNESFVEVLVEIEGAAPVRHMDGGWSVELTLEEV